MKWLAIAFAGVLGLVTPAEAVLTDAEQADVRRLVESVWDTRSAMNYVKRAVMAECLAAETRPVLHEALHSLYRAQVEHWQALGTLLRTSNEQPKRQPDLTPEQWHKRAWYYNDRFLADLDTADARIRTARRHCPGDADYQDDLRRAGEIALRNAIVKRKAMARSLTFAEPFPAVRPGKTIPTLVGPHGDYLRVQWNTNFGKKYMLDSLGHLLTWFKEAPFTEVTEKREPFRSALTQWAAGMDLLDRMTALIAGVTFTAEEADEDAFCRTLRWRKIATREAPTRIGSFQAFVGKMVGGPLGRTVSKSGDAWRHGWGNFNVWAADVFPESSRCSSPFVNN